jgi:hypothetical protein
MSRPVHLCEECGLQLHRDLWARGHSCIAAMFEPPPATEYLEPPSRSADPWPYLKSETESK